MRLPSGWVHAGGDAVGSHRLVLPVLLAVVLALAATPVSAQPAPAEPTPVPAPPPEAPDPAAEAEAARLEAERVEAERLEAERLAREQREAERTVTLTKRLDRASRDLASSERTLVSALAERNRVSGEAVVAGYEQELAEEQRIIARRDGHRATYELTRARRERDEASAALAAHVANAYRSGITASTGPFVAVEALLQSRNPSDFIAGVTYLESVAHAGVGRVTTSTDAIARWEAALAQAQAARASAASEIERAAGARAEAEALLPAREARLTNALGAHAAAARDVVRYAATERMATEQGDPHPSRVGNVDLTEQLDVLGAGAEALARGVQSGAARIAAGAAGVRPWRDLGCPVDGSVQFVNDWGFPRSGGRSHEGTDVFAAHGTPVVAVADGVVVRVSRQDVGLGGLTVTYDVDGYRIYNAHLGLVLPGIEPGVAVLGGQRLGTVGVTGNARGTPPHNHLGLSLPSGAWVNPYPVLRTACGEELTVAALRRASTASTAAAAGTPTGGATS